MTKTAAYPHCKQVACGDKVFQAAAAMKLRAAAAISLLCAFFTALTLASSPQLHEKLHNVDAQHECAATLLVSGSYHSAGPPPVLLETPASAWAPAFFPRDFGFAIAPVAASILEHAPPVLI
ncbi:MAG: hypothetical protein JO354_10075 [Verrucomicrobia bacterium]|nr:hypothetical protein [Verrucomicrobiota bacterium]